MRATLYLIGVICFAIATAAGVIALVLDKGHWTQVVIPAALLVASLALWWTARKSRASR